MLFGFIISHITDITNRAYFTAIQVRHKIQL